MRSRVRRADAGGGGGGMVRSVVARGVVACTMNDYCAELKSSWNCSEHAMRSCEVCSEKTSTSRRKQQASSGLHNRMESCRGRRLL